MIVLCDITTKKIISISRLDYINPDPAMYVKIRTDSYPDMLTMRMNDTKDGFRNVTPAELATDADSLKDDILMSWPPGVLALIKAVNDGSFVPGSGYTWAEALTIIKAKM